MNKNLKEKAITLIALVITIVVLVILAGVAINLSLGENGLFNKAKYAKESYQNAEDKEQIDIAKATNEIDRYVDGDRDINKYEEILLYQNNDEITSEYTYDARQLQINVAEYKKIKILNLVYASNSAGQYTIHTLDISENLPNNGKYAYPLINIVTGNSNAVRCRYIIIPNDKSHIQITDGYYGGVSKASMIPIKIYGLK